MLTATLVRFRNTLPLALAALFLVSSPASAQSSNVAYAYSANTGSDTVSIFKVTPSTGQFTPINFLPMNGVTAPIALAQTSNGIFLYVPVNPDNSAVSEYRVNPANGSLTFLDSVSTGK